MKKLDFAVQSITFITAIGLLLVSTVLHEMFFFLVWVQLFLGGWQLLSYVISLTGIMHAENRIKKCYLNYTIAIAIYFLIWYLYNFLHIETDLAGIYIFGPPWIIALYYYHTSYLKLKIQKGQQHSYLDLN